MTTAMARRERQLNTTADWLIFCLLSERSIRSAAKAAGCSRATIFRWMRMPAFMRRLEESRRMYRESVIEHLSLLKAKELRPVERWAERLGVDPAKIRNLP